MFLKNLKFKIYMKRTVQDSLFNKVPWWRPAIFLKKIRAEMSSCEFGEVFKKIYFVEQIFLYFFFWMYIVFLIIEKQYSHIFRTTYKTECFHSVTSPIHVYDCYYASSSSNILIFLGQLIKLSAFFLLFRLFTFMIVTTHCSDH